MGLTLKQPHNDLPMLSVIGQVHQVKINIYLVHALGYTCAIHLPVKSRRQCRFHSSGELRLRLLMKSLIYGLLSIEISLQLRNLVLHVLQQLHQLLGISRWLGSHIDISTSRGGYCNEVQKSSIHRTPKCTQNLNVTPETKCKVLNLTLGN